MSLCEILCIINFRFHLLQIISHNALEKHITAGGPDPVTHHVDRLRAHCFKSFVYLQISPPKHCKLLRVEQVRNFVYFPQELLK